MQKTQLVLYKSLVYCDVYVKCTKLDKLESKFDKYIFFRYPIEIIGCQFFNLTEKKVFISRHGVFLQKKFILGEDSRIKLKFEGFKSP